MIADTSNESEVAARFRSIQESWSNALSNLGGSQTTIPEGERQTAIDSLFRQFTSSPPLLDDHGALTRLCYWEAGRYSLEMQILTEEPKRVFRERWQFELTEKDCQMLRNNAIHMIQVACNRAQPQFLFARAAYDEAPPSR